jgi:hypothetical protein
MAKNRKSQSAAIRFGPALKALFLCLLIAGAAVGYVWQKGQIDELGRQFTACEIRLKQLRTDNQKSTDQLAVLRSPLTLDRRVKELKLGLAPAQPMQVWRLPEPIFASPPKINSPRQFAEQTAVALTP